MRIVYRGIAITLAALSLTGSALAAPVETVLYKFTGFPADGSSPPAGLIADKQGALYGTTRLGGTSGGVEGFGTVFKLTPPAKGQTAWTETVLYNFTGDGFSPRAGLIADKHGALYGTTILGGIGGDFFRPGFGTVLTGHVETAARAATINNARQRRHTPERCLLVKLRMLVSFC
jgi:hypothetical protein